MRPRREPNSCNSTKIGKARMSQILAQKRRSSSHLKRRRFLMTREVSEATWVNHHKLRLHAKMMQWAIDQNWSPMPHSLKTEITYWTRFLRGPMFHLLSVLQRPLVIDWPKLKNSLRRKLRRERQLKKRSLSSPKVLPRNIDTRSICILGLNCRRRIFVL